MAKKRNYEIEKKWNIASIPKIALRNPLYSNAFLKLLQLRGVASESAIDDFIDPKYSNLSDPFIIPDMDKAVNRIIKAVKDNEKIAIYGDYDVDGVTATSVLYYFFKTVLADVITYIPSRVDEGYGLNNDAIKFLAETGVTLIITVDCGITSFNEVIFAKKNKIDLVVTDHHSLFTNAVGKVVLPKAIAVINPKRMPVGSPVYDLAGVAVAFYLIRALQSYFLEKMPFGQEKWLLDLVALGTICDIVPLKGENRILANYGLKVLKKTRHIGIKALSTISEVSVESLDSYKVGFLLGPRLNASGRLEHAKRSLDLLTTESFEEAQISAHELNELNLERQELTERIVEEARIIISSSSPKNIYLLAQEDWSAGVVGIVASRLVEEFRRPMLIAQDQGEYIKGSARSVNGFNIIEALASISDSLEHFGGHSFAAGFSIKKENLAIVGSSLTEIADKQIGLLQLEPTIDIDIEISLDEITLDFIHELSLLEPYGRDNPKPVFALKGLQVIDYRLVGNPAIHLKMTISSGNKNLSGIAFGYGESAKFDNNKLYDLAVTLELNEWNNHKNVEFRLIDIREHYD